MVDGNCQLVKRIIKGKATSYLTMMEGFLLDKAHGVLHVQIIGFYAAVYGVTVRRLGYSRHVLNLPQNIQHFLNKLPPSVPLLSIKRTGADNSKSHLKVRREKVLHGLLWLKQNFIETVKLIMITFHAFLLMAFLVRHQQKNQPNISEVDATSAMTAAHSCLSHKTFNSIHQRIIGLVGYGDLLKETEDITTKALLN